MLREQRLLSLQRLAYWRLRLLEPLQHRLALACRQAAQEAVKVRELVGVLGERRRGLLLLAADDHNEEAASASSVLLSREMRRARE